MDAADVLVRLLAVDLSLPNSVQVELIIHENKLNWRQRNPTVSDQVRNLRDGLVHDGPFRGRLVKLRHLEEELGLIAGQVGVSEVVSVSSRLFDGAGDTVGHLAIMNLHPEGLDDVNALVAAISET